MSSWGIASPSLPSSPPPERAATWPNARLVAYPGSFNPPTVGHLALAEAALEASQADAVAFIVSEMALGKETVEHPRFEDRIAVLRSVAESRPWMRVRTTRARLLAEMAAGYGWLLIGADKWVQINELQWYGGREDARSAALARLPSLIVAARLDYAVPEEARILVVPEATDVSSTAARLGAHAMMAAEALAFAERTGAWINVARYEAERQGNEASP